MFDLISPFSDFQTFIERLQNHREIQTVQVDRITAFQISKKVSRNAHLDLEGHLMKPPKKTLLPSAWYRHWKFFFHLVSFLSSGATCPWLIKSIKVVNNWDTKYGFGRYTLVHIFCPPPNWMIFSLTWQTFCQISPLSDVQTSIERSQNDRETKTVP